jgi:hypothetical protein
LGVGRKAENLTLLKNTVGKSKEEKPGRSNSRRNGQIWQNVQRKAMAQKDCFANDDDDDDDDGINNIPQ